MRQRTEWVRGQKWSVDESETRLSAQKKMKAKTLSFGLGLLLAAGCTVPNQARYQVSAVAPSATTATQADKDAVKEILQTAAQSLKLKDLTASAIAPNAIVYFQEIDSNTPVKLIAWSEGGKILIELMHWPDTLGETLAYRRAREYVESELQRRFGDRSSTVAYKKIVARPPHQANR